MVILWWGSQPPSRPGEPDEYARDLQLRDAAIAWAWRHPGSAMRLAVVKFLRMWNIWPNEPRFSSWPLRLGLVFSYVPVMLLALTIHEWAHAYVAWRLGDPTARMLGRLTLNPLAHLDPFGTIALVLVGFGWARPVPVNMANLRHPRRDMMWIAAAGPISNLIQAILFGFMFRLMAIGAAGGGFFVTMCTFGVFINCALAVFNLWR